MESLRMPPGLNRGVPRDVRLTAGGKFVYIVAAALLVASVVAVVVLRVRGVQESDERQLLIERGAAVDAHIVRLWRASNEQKQPWLAYRFMVDGRGVSGPGRRSLSPIAKWRIHSKSALGCCRCT